MGVEQIIQNPLTLLLFAAFVFINITQKRVEAVIRNDGAAIEMQSAYVRVSDKRMVDLEQRVNKLSQDLEIARKGEQDKNQLIDDLQVEVNGLRNEVRQLKDKVSGMDEEKRHLIEENESLRKERDNLLRRALEAEAKASTLEDIVNRLTGTKPPTGPLDPGKVEGTGHA